MATVEEIMKLLKVQSEADKEERAREREVEREILKNFID